MFNKWLIARPKNLQPAAPRKHVVIYSKSNGDSEEHCYTCCTEAECTKAIKSEYDSMDVLSAEEEGPKTAPETVIGKQQSEDRRDDYSACCTKDPFKSEHISTDAPSAEEEKPETAPVAVIEEPKTEERQASPEPVKKKSKKKARKRVINDEEQKNPLNIPQWGYFMEHDLRRTNDEESRKKNRRAKRGWDEGSWKHDRFQEEEQAPKTQEELIATYGFDIRACSNPNMILRGQATKKRTSPKEKVQKKQQKKTPPKMAYTELKDHDNWRTPSKCPGVYEAEQPTQLQKKSTYASSTSEYKSQTKPINPSRKDSSDTRRNGSNMGSSKER
ncbi:protein CASC3-like [Dendropsophus ebraccatus]|uniref:protein CASC3-like n=1 Tax=Dendropsophus ebraccatus TaxID=150705 RepID=UPI0038315C6E